MVMQSDPGAEIGAEDLRRAIEERELFLLYQPEVQIERMDIGRFEALVRWRHKRHGVIGPEHFIGVAERCRLINGLTREVVRQAVERVRTWRASGLPAEIAINISGSDLSDTGIADDLRRLCETASVRTEWVTLELTESAAARAADTFDVLTRLRLMGFRLSIDDFGTGYASFTRLRRLPFSELKIDREFVSNYAISHGNRTIIKTVVDLAHNLGLSVVAEGVEDEATIHHLRALGCDYAQGHFFSVPLPANQILQWMDGWMKRRGWPGLRVS